jgi:hypothetical protein
MAVMSVKPVPARYVVPGVPCDPTGPNLHDIICHIWHRAGMAGREPWL